MKALLAKLTVIKDWLIRSSWKIKLLIFVIIIGVGWFVVPKVLGATSNKPQYQTAQVQRGSIISTLSESGNVSATSQTNVTSPTDGIIEEVYVKNGDVVTAGQNLFKVKSTATPQQVASAYAQYQSAVNSEQSAEQQKLAMESTLEKDRQAVLDAQDNEDYKNAHEWTTNPATKSNYTQLEKDSIDSALTNARETFSADEKKYQQAGTSIGAAQSSLTAALLSYQATQDSVVTAPIAGTVANFSDAVNSNVSASSGNNSNGTSSSNSTSSSSSNSSGGSTVLVLGDFSQLTINAQVSEVDIPKVHAGQKATVTLDAYPDKTFVGTVDSIDTIGTNSSGVVSYNAYIILVSPPPDILSGMSASAIIQLDRHDDVLTVPTSAVQTNNGQSTVRVLKDGKITQTPVEAGISSDTDTEITSGLSEGDTVVTSIALPSTTGSQSTSPFSGLGGRGFGGGFGGGGRGGGGGGRAGN